MGILQVLGFGIRDFSEEQPPVPPAPTNSTPATGLDDSHYNIGHWDCQRGYCNRYGYYAPREGSNQPVWIQHDGQYVDIASPEYAAWYEAQGW